MLVIVVEIFEGENGVAKGRKAGDHEQKWWRRDRLWHVSGYRKSSEEKENSNTREKSIRFRKAAHHTVAVVSSPRTKYKPVDVLHEQLTYNRYVCFTQILLLWHLADVFFDTRNDFKLVFTCIWSGLENDKTINRLVISPYMWWCSRWSWPFATCVEHMAYLLTWPLPMSIPRCMWRINGLPTWPIPLPVVPSAWSCSPFSKVGL